MVEWRIYYGDESTFDSTQGDPEDAPSHGVVCIVMNDPDVGRLILKSWDWYYFKRSDEKGDWGWYGADIYGMLDWFMSEPRICSSLKMGRTFANPRYQAVCNAALEDTDFQLKSATHPLESPRVE